MALFSSGPGLWRRIRLVLDPQSVNALTRDTQKALAAATNPAVAQRNLSLIERGFGFIKSQALGLAGTVAAVFSARKVVEWVDSWRLIEGRLKLVTRNAEELLEVREELFSISQATRTNFEDTAALFQRVQLNAAQLGRNTRDILDFTKAVQQAIRVSGANQQEASAGLIQLSQALASGTLRGDEFRSIMENLPGLARAIADGLGVTRGQLRAMSREGQLTAEEVVGAVLKMKEQIDEDFGSVPLTIGQSFTVLGNSLMRFFGEADSAAGVSADLSKALVQLAHSIDGLRNPFKTVAVATADFFRQFGRTGMAMVNSVLIMVDELLVRVLEVKRRMADIRGDREAVADFDRMIGETRQKIADRGQQIRDAVFGVPTANREAAESMVQSFLDAVGQLETQAKAARDRAARDAVREARDAQLDVLDATIKRQEQLQKMGAERLRLPLGNDQRNVLRQQIATGEQYLVLLRDIRDTAESVGAAWIALDNQVGKTAEEIAEAEDKRIALLIEAHDLGVATAADTAELAALQADINKRLQQGNLALAERVRLTNRLKEINDELRSQERRVSFREAPKFDLAEGPQTEFSRQFQMAAQRAAFFQEMQEKNRKKDMEAAFKPTADKGLFGLDQDELNEQRALQNALVENWMLTHQTLLDAAQGTALGVAGAWQDAFEAVMKEGKGFTGFFEALFAGMGAAILGGLAQIAGAKVIENLALAAQALGMGWAQTLIGNVAGPAIATKSAGFHFAAAAGWAALGGTAGAAQGAIGGGGAAAMSGGLPTGARDPAGRLADSIERRSGSTINLYISGVDPDNPRHQELIGKTVNKYDKRQGDRITVKRWNGDPSMNGSQP